MAKRGKNRECAGIFARSTPNFLGHPSPSPHFLGLPSPPPSQFFFKSEKNIYTYFFGKWSLPPKISHTPPLGVFLTPSLSVQLKILPYLCYTGGEEEHIFISGLYSPNFLVRSSKSLDNFWQCYSRRLLWKSQLNWFVTASWVKDIISWSSVDRGFIRIFPMGVGGD